VISRRRRNALIQTLHLAFGRGDVWLVCMVVTSNAKWLEQIQRQMRNMEKRKYANIECKSLRVEPRVWGITHGGSLLFGR
jgi:hypothetical protein